MRPASACDAGAAKMSRATSASLLNTVSRGGYTVSQKSSALLPRCMHGLQGGLYDKAVRLSVCLSLSVKRVDCDITKESSAQIFIPYERSFILVFYKKNGWWRATHST